MKTFRIFCLILALCLCFTFTACGKSTPQEKNNFITAPEATEIIQTEQPIPEEAETTAPEATDSLPPEPQKSVQIDLDLTKLSSTMVYAEVYNMMLSPDEYIGKTVKMTGSFTIFQATDDYGQVIPDSLYFACIIADAAACCAQGIEFVLEGDYAYPDDYPELESNITITGEFQTYEENGRTYVHLVNATMETL